MQARIKNPLMLFPDALPALLKVNEAADTSELPPTIKKLIHLRASQINSCSFCVDMHSQELKKMGESDARIFAVAAWEDTSYFTDAERAVLALTEAATRLGDRSKAVPDVIWEEAAKHFDEQKLGAIVIQIALINFFNRINVPIRQVAGAWHPQA